MDKPITDDQAREKMLACDSGSREVAHGLADDLLCEVLEALGYRKTVDAFREIKKWYA